MRKKGSTSKRIYLGIFFERFEIKNKIKDIMWEHCALVRDGEGLKGGLSLIEKIGVDDLARVWVPDSSRVFNKGLVEALEAINLVELSEMAIRSALMREETRKSHYRTDFPKSDNKKWLRNIIIKKKGGRMVFTTILPVITKLRPPEEEEADE